MKLILCFYFIVAAKAANFTNKLEEITTLDANLDKIQSRKTFVNGVINILSALNNDNSTNIIRNKRTQDQITFSQVLYIFLNKTYVCGSSRSKEVAPDLLSTIEAISQLPFMNYIITDTVKINTVNTVKKCAYDTKTKKTKKRKSKRKKDVTRSKKNYNFFTGALEESVATKGKDTKVLSIPTYKLKDLKSNNLIIDQFRSILDGIVNDIEKKYNNKRNSKEVKIIFEIGDHLKDELNKKDGSKEEYKAKQIDKRRLPKNDVLFRTYNDIKNLEELNESRHRLDSEIDSEEKNTAEEDVSNNIVFNSNMEIFVKMNKPFEGYRFF